MLSKLSTFLNGTIKEKYFKRLCLAGLCSLFVHFFLINGVNLSLPKQSVALSLIEVNLVSEAKPKLPEPVKSEAIKPQTKKETPKPKPKVKPQPQPQPEQVKPDVPKEESVVPNQLAPESNIEPVTPQPAQQAESKNLDDVVQAQEIVQSEQSTADAEQSATQVAPSGEKVPPYKKIKIQFDAFRGSGGMQIGTAVATYEAKLDGTYQLSFILEPNFIASLIIKGSLSQTSKGTYSNDGLKPEHYEYNFANKANRIYRAEFDWANNKINMETSEGKTNADLSQGAQDLLSFMFQFMYVPPLQEMELAITTGRKFRTYTYSFEGEELLKTKMGEMRTLHILNVGGDDREKTELWLAIDYRNLPVKIRKTEKDGNVIEQVITSLETES